MVRSVWAGASQLTSAWPLPGVIVTFVGASGGAAGNTALDAAEATLDPVAFLAVTVKV